MRIIRNFAFFLLGVVLVTGCSALMNYAAAEALTDTAFSNEMAQLTEETNSIIVQSTLGIAFCLGFVAGSFR